LNEVGEVDKYKTHSVTKGYFHNKEYISLKYLLKWLEWTQNRILTLAALRSWKIYQYEILNQHLSKVSKDIYMWGCQSVAKRSEVSVTCTSFIELCMVTTLKGFLIILKHV